MKPLKGNLFLTLQTEFLLLTREKDYFFVNCSYSFRCKISQLIITSFGNDLTFVINKIE